MSRKDSPEDDVSCPVMREHAGDLVFLLCDRQDRLYNRLNRKITRLDERVTELEERGRE
jgi:hypothetical protein